MLTILVNITGHMMQNLSWALAAPSRLSIQPDQALKMIQWEMFADLQDKQALRVKRKMMASVALPELPGDLEIHILNDRME